MNAGKNQNIVRERRQGREKGEINVKIIQSTDERR